MRPTLVLVVAVALTELADPARGQGGPLPISVPSSPFRPRTARRCSAAIRDPFRWPDNRPSSHHAVRHGPLLAWSLNDPGTFRGFSGTLDALGRASAW